MYKNRETFTFRGLTYRYLKVAGEWRLVDKKTKVDVPREIHPYSGAWETNFSVGRTPQEALAKWFDDQLNYYNQEVTTRREQLVSAKVELMRLKQKDLRA